MRLSGRCSQVSSPTTHKIWNILVLRLGSPSAHPRFKVLLVTSALQWKLFIRGPNFYIPHTSLLNLANVGKVPRGKPELAQGNWPQQSQLSTYGATDVCDVLSNSTILQQGSLPQLASYLYWSTLCLTKTYYDLITANHLCLALRYVNAKSKHVRICHNDF